MLGQHCIKTWSATQQAYALSSAEAELYGLVEAVTRGKGLVTLSSELGFSELSGMLRLGTDSSAAKSFVSRRVLGKMRHIDIRDLWLQKEVLENTKSVCMMDSNTLADIAAIKQLQTEVLKYTKSLCMMESISLAKFEAIK